MSPAALGSLTQCAAAIYLPALALNLSNGPSTSDLRLRALLAQPRELLYGRRRLRVRPAYCGTCAPSGDLRRPQRGRRRYTRSLPLPHAHTVTKRLQRTLRSAAVRQQRKEVLCRRPNPAGRVRARVRGNARVRRRLSLPCGQCAPRRRHSPRVPWAPLLLPPAQQQLHGLG